VFRFDPHGGAGGLLGLGVARTVMLATVLAIGVLCLYQGRLILATVLLVIAAPVLLASWQGLPLIAWVALRACYLLAGPRRWETDPELVAISEPIVLSDAWEEGRC
jgi:hypothetical protein